MMPAVFSHALRRGSALAWALAVVLSLAAGPALGQVRGTWNVDTDGLWSGSSNWLNNTIAGGVSGTANFTNNITATRTISLDTNRSLGAFVFGDSDTTSLASWIVAPVTGGTTITMANGTNSALITVNALGTGATATISAVLASSTSPSIIKNGVGTLVLTATNNFTGKLEITSGTLQVGADRNLGAVGTSASDRITISNGAALRTSASFTLNAARGITIGSGGGTISPNGGVLTIAAPLTGSGNTASVTGASALILQNTSGTATDVNWDFGGNGGVRAFFEGANALGTGNVRVRSAIRLTSQSMTTGTLANAVTLDDGAGITARSSGGAQTYTNVTLPSTGTLIFNQDDQNTAALRITSGKELTGNLTINTSQGGASVSVGDVTLSGIFSGASGALIKSGTGASGRLILTGANTYAGNTTINTGTLQIGNGGTVGSLSTSSVITGSAGATLAFNRSDTITSGSDFKDAIIGGINLAQLGSGTLILTAANTIGKTSITNGVLQISNVNQLGAAPGTFTSDQLTISNGATLRAAPMTLTATRGITIGSGGGKLDVSSSSGNLIANSRFTGAGQTVTVTGSGGIRLGNTTGGASNVNWDFAMNSSQRAFFDGSNALGTGTVTVRSGIRLVSQTQAPTNGEVTNSVTLEDGAGLAARSSGGAVTYTNVALPSTGSLIFNQDDQPTSALTIASGKELTGLLTINTSQGGATVAVGDVTLSGNFSGASGGITKIGTGTSGRLILGGVNTYGGNTTISTGTLALAATASIANSAAINVASGASFDVSAVSGGFSLGTGQVLGGSGTVLGDILFANGSALNVTIGSPISASGGTVTFGNAFGIASLTGIDWGSLNLDTPYTVISTSQTFTADDILNFGEANKFDVGGGREAYFTTGSLNVVVTAVPEPSTIVAAMIGLGGMGLAAARRRFHRVER